MVTYFEWVTMNPVTEPLLGRLAGPEELDLLVSPSYNSHLLVDTADLTVPSEISMYFLTLLYHVLNFRSDWD